MAAPGRALVSFEVGRWTRKTACVSSWACGRAHRGRTALELLGDVATLLQLILGRIVDEDVVELVLARLRRAVVPRARPHAREAGDDPHELAAHDGLHVVDVVGDRRERQPLIVVQALHRLLAAAAKEAEVAAPHERARLIARRRQVLRPHGSPPLDNRLRKSSIHVKQKEQNHP
eukprot:2362319-Pleurochrysis_carterae.AAC.5